ncbi:hypothetical protein M9H77_01770 [Catharanthus roseus]|uniref:Uncharacterized protein n=1 Tax=Catharanthus roseus TaxID=4058 RepID=A0ACC0C6F9_CATRO|nr:hypothetical protein M9H77_01770 [Catharanthus roseus]
MATRRNGRVLAARTDEAVERFLRFRPPEFYGETEQEAKNALRATFATFRLREMAKDWWLRASEAQALKINHGPGLIFKKNSKKNTYLDGFGGTTVRIGHPYQQWDSRQQLKPLQGRRWRIKRLHIGKQLLAQLQPPINVLDKDSRNLEISRDPVVNKGSGMEAGEP